jgi:hypothetical protein
MSFESRIAEIARETIDGNVGIVEAYRLINSLRVSMPTGEYDSAFNIFVAVDSDTDHLPNPETRHLWSEDGLQKADKELDQLGEHYRADVIEGCHELLSKFGT